MPRTPPALLAAAAVVLLLAGPPPAARAAPGPTVPEALRALADTGAIAPEAAGRARATYAAARRARSRLTGARRRELAGAMAQVEGVARRGGLTATRVPLAVETLRRNTQQWTTGRLLRSGERVRFAPSELLWQAYPGLGVQLQWLGTFGKANALVQQELAGRLEVLLDEALALSAQRAGGIAFESWFAFSGSAPPWVSGLGQGTGLQALSRAAALTGRPEYLDAARAGLGIFATAAPEGVAVPSSAGVHYLQYSGSPRLRVLNGFVQALVGLHDVPDPAARERFAAGEAALRAELPQADTGAWSRYSVGGRESDLGYHTLLRDFLAALCERMAGAGEDGALYCRTAERFTADLTTPPAIRLAPVRGARRGRTTRVAFELSKVSDVRVTLLRAGRPVLDRTARWGAGRHGVAVRPVREGPLSVVVRATDLAGNAAAASGVLTVAR